mmetsp:Transcript_10450/g.22215  ORF Transcript_10450/g.22215 Transcript_10450/m.22215 type:complete len:131 (-) Transcript_10450:81-473(-)
MRLNAEDAPSKFVAISTPFVINSMDPDSALSLSPGRSVMVAICDSSPSILDDTARSIGLKSSCAGLLGRYSGLLSFWCWPGDGSEDSDRLDPRSKGATTARCLAMYRQDREIATLLRVAFDNMLTYSQQL